jgi:CysZ protein
MSHSLAIRDAFAALRAGIALSLGDEHLRRRIAVSVVVNGVSFVALLACLLWAASEGVSWVIDGVEVADPAWYESLWYSVKSGLRWLLYGAVVLGALLYAPALFMLLASVVLPPFHGPVFAGARARAGGPKVTGGGVALVTTLKNDLRRLVRFVGYSVILLPLNLVPLLGTGLYVVAQFTLSAKTLGWDLLSHHFELHGLGLEEQRAWVQERRGLVFALGAGATLLAMIPLAQVLFITTNVAGAGVLSAWLDGAPRER